MRAETKAAVAIAVVVVAGFAVAVTVPEITPDREEPGPPPGNLDIADVTISRGDVSGDTATLEVTTYLAHRDGPSENVTVVVRAIDLDSGLVATETETVVGDVTGDREVAVPGPITVERQGGYRIDVLVYEDGRRIETTQQTVEGVGSLQPEYARSSVSFHRFDHVGGGVADDGLPPVQYSVRSVEEGSGDQESALVELQVSGYVTNRGGEVGDLRVEFVLQQVESKVVAARASTDVGDVRPGRTVVPQVTVTVPDGYNYYIDAILYKDGVIVATARGAANLNPREPVRVNRSDEEGGLTVGDFASEEGPGTPAPTSEPESTPSPYPTETPGFGVGAALVALAAVALLTRRDP